MQERPYLILTLRRTGGTSLMSLMGQLSSFPALQHEPLNKRRIWGEITRDFLANRDVGAMMAGLSKGLEPRPNIKHCFEMVPAEITHALIKLCEERGYRIFTLLRRDDVSRLRSLFLAMATGAWGDMQAAEIYPKILSGEHLLEPVDLKQVRHSYGHDQQRLKQMRALIARDGICVEDLVFEDLYARDGAIGVRVCQVLRSLGIDLTADDPRITAFASATGQGSAKVFDFLPNATEFSALLDELRGQQDARDAKS